MAGRLLITRLDIGKRKMSMQRILTLNNLRYHFGWWCDGAIDELGGLNLGCNMEGVFRRLRSRREDRSSFREGLRRVYHSTIVVGRVGIVRERRARGRPPEDRATENSSETPIWGRLQCGKGYLTSD